MDEPKLDKYPEGYYFNEGKWTFFLDENIKFSWDGTPDERESVHI